MLRRPVVLAALAVTACCAPQAWAASASWTTATSGSWSTGPWSAAFPNGTSEIATFDSGLDWTGQTVTVDGTYTVGQILAADAANAGGGLILSGGTLVLDNGAAKPVIQTNLNLTEPGSVAPFNNPLRITSTLQGTNGFEKTGPGYLSLEGTNTFTGNVKLTAAASGGGSFVRLINDNNLGDAANDIEVAANSQAVGLYVSTGFTVTLNAARNITTSSASGTQDFWVKTKGTGNLIVDGVISGQTRFRKNDAGIATLRGANTFTGGTLLDGGTLRLAGGDNRLPSGSTVTFNAASTLDITDTSQTLNGLGLLGAGQTNAIIGTGGTLILQGTGDYTVNTTVTGTSLNMEGLTNFTFNRAGNSLQLNANGLNVVNTINLAKAGTNNLTATNVRFGGGGNFAGQNVLIGLGQNNNINAANELVIGYFQGNGNVSFQSGLTNPVLTVRGAGGGTAPVPLMTVGSTNSGNQASTGILNLAGGSIDLIATSLNVARHFANANTNATGTLTMPAGTIVADTLSLANKTNTTGTPTLTGTVNQQNGTVTATTVYLGNNEGTGTPNLVANYNLAGGELQAATITGNGATFGSGTVRNLSLNGGTLRNKLGGDLSVNGVDATSQGRINLIVGASGGTVHADAGRTVTIGSFTPVTGTGLLSKNGAGRLLLNTTVAPNVDVNQGTLGGSGTLSGSVTVDAGATLAPGNSIGTIAVGAASISGTLAVEWQDTGAGNADGLIDLLAVTNSLNIAATTLQLTDLAGSSVANDDVYVLATYGSLVGTSFAGVSGLPSGYEVSYDYNGNSIALVPIPEPTALAVLTLAALPAIRRRTR